MNLETGVKVVHGRVRSRTEVGPPPEPTSSAYALSLTAACLNLQVIWSSCGWTSHRYTADIDPNVVEDTHHRCERRQGRLRARHPEGAYGAWQVLFLCLTSP